MDFKDSSELDSPPEQESLICSGKLEITLEQGNLVDEEVLLMLPYELHQRAGSGATDDEIEVYSAFRINLNEIIAANNISASPDALRDEIENQISEYIINASMVCEYPIGEDYDIIWV